MGFENGHLLRVVLHASQAGGDVVNVLHYDLDDSAIAGADNDPQALADRFRDDVIPKFAACFASAWTILPVVVEDERDPLHLTATRSAWTAGTATVGTRAVASDGMPPGICGVNTWLTEHIGRRFRGRLFLGGTITEDDQNNGFVRMDRIGVAWQQLVDAIPRQPDIATGTSDVTAKQCVYSRTQRAASLDPYASAVTGNIIRPVLHYLRSRAK